jgi:hypothetical protein
MNTPKTVSELYPPKWVKAADLGGHVVTVVISDVTVESFRLPDGTHRASAVLAFEGKTKRLILNKTQCKQLAEITGSERFEEWVGRSVSLAPAMAQNGKPTISIRAGHGDGKPGGQADTDRKP